MTTAIILAGGLGTRLRSAVPDLPKPMAPVGGRPFLEHLMDYWIDQGVKQFILSVGYLKELVIAHFEDSYRLIPLKYAIEQEPLGTGGGLLQAANGLKEPFLVLNGDTFFEVSLDELYKFHNEQSSECTFSLFRTNAIGRYMGLEVKEYGEISALKSDMLGVNRFANGGVYLISPSFIAKTKFVPGHKLSLEDDILPAYIAQGGKLYGCEFTGSFIDIGVPADYFRSVEILTNY